MRAPWLGFGLPHPVGSHHPASASEAFAPCLLLATSGARADQIGAGAGAGSSEVNAACRGAAGIIARRGGGGGGEECEEQKARRCLQPGPFNSCGEAGGAGGDRPAAGVLEDSNGR